MELMDPSQRPRKTRRGARVIVRCGGRVLLIQDSDPGIAGVHWWVLPGGGVDAGEPGREAAARELWEETGFKIDPGLLQGPVAHRIAVHGYSDRVLVQDEDFWLVDVTECFEVSQDGWTEAEKERMGQARWFTRSEMDEVTVWPAVLGDLLDWHGEQLVELGAMEESTVPV